MIRHVLSARMSSSFVIMMSGLACANVESPDVEPGSDFLSGRVRTPEDTPLAARVILFSANGERRETRTDAEGSFRIEGAPFGPAKLVVNSERGDGALREVEVIDGGANSLGDIVAGSLGRLPELTTIHGIGFEERLTSLSNVEISVPNKVGRRLAVTSQLFQTDRGQQYHFQIVDADGAVWPVPAKWFGERTVANAVLCGDWLLSVTFLDPSYSTSYFDLETGIELRADDPTEPRPSLCDKVRENADSFLHWASSGLMVIHRDPSKPVEYLVSTSNSERPISLPSLNSNTDPMVFVVAAGNGCELAVVDWPSVTVKRIPVDACTLGFVAGAHAYLTDGKQVLEASLATGVQRVLHELQVGPNVVQIAHDGTYPIVGVRSLAAHTFYRIEAGALHAVSSAVEGDAAASCLNPLRPGGPCTLEPDGYGKLKLVSREYSGGLSVQAWLSNGAIQRAFTADIDGFVDLHRPREDMEVLTSFDADTELAQISIASPGSALPEFQPRTFLPVEHYFIGVSPDGEWIYYAAHDVLSGFLQLYRVLRDDGR